MTIMREVVVSEIVQAKIAALNLYLTYVAYFNALGVTLNFKIHHYADYKFTP